MHSFGLWTVLFGLLHIEGVSSWIAYGHDFELVFTSNAYVKDLFIMIFGQPNSEVILDGPYSKLPIQGLIRSKGILTVKLSSAFDVEATIDTIQPKGLRVLTKSNVHVNIINSQATSYDSSIVFPVQTLVDGVKWRYMAVSYTISPDVQFKSLVGFVASYNQTYITIIIKLANTSETVSFHGTQYSNGAVVKAVINKHDVIQLAAATDVTGTQVTSDKPMSLFSGATCASIPITATTCDHIMEQIPSIDQWGTEFVTAPLMGRTAGDIFRVIAGYDLTFVFIDGNGFRLNKGEFYEWEIASNESAVVNANHGVLLMQYAKSFSADFVGDSTMLLVPPIDGFHMYYGLYVLDIFQGYVSLVVPTNFVDFIVVDQTFLIHKDAVVVAVHQKMNLTVLQVRLDYGIHSIWSPNYTEFGLQIYGFGLNSSAISFGRIAAGRKLEPSVNDSCLEQQCMNDATCLNLEKSFVCICKPGFKGTLCNIREINSSSLMSTVTDEFITEVSFLTPDTAVPTETPVILSSAVSELIPAEISQSPAITETVLDSTLQTSQSLSDIHDYSVITTDTLFSSFDLLADSSYVKATPLLSSYMPQTADSSVGTLSSTIAPHATLSSSPESTSYNCSCSCISKTRILQSANRTEEDIRTLMRMLQDKLRVKTARLSSTVRKKISVHDYRPSAVTLGFSGLFILISLLGAIVLLDCQAGTKQCFDFENKVNTKRKTPQNHPTMMN